MKILMVLTSHDQLGDTGKKTGFWLEEFAAPYYVLKDAGAEITLASPKGGMPLWQDKLYVALARSATNATDFYHIPSGRAVELARVFRNARAPVVAVADEQHVIEPGLAGRQRHHRDRSDRDAAHRRHRVRQPEDAGRLRARQS